MLAAAHRGILYIDEVNLLGDHLVDLLLDAAAMGVNHVEREGLTFRHPSRFVLVGTMNPEEGDLRPQLLDRFGLAVDVEPMTDPSRRAEVVRRRLAFDADPVAFRRDWDAADRREGERIAGSPSSSCRRSSSPTRSSTRSAPVAPPRGPKGCGPTSRSSRRPRALAAYEGRTTVTPADVDAVAELALAHRRTTPRPPGPAPRRLVLATRTDRHPNDPPAPDREFYADRENRNASQASAESPTPTVGDAGPKPSRSARPSPIRPPVGTASAPRPAADLAGPSRFDGRPPVLGASSSGPKYRVAVGRPVRSARPSSPPPPGRSVGAGRDGGLLIVRPSDLRDKVREAPARHLVLFVVDASRSMGARRRMAETKATVLSLLVDAYQKRDWSAWSRSAASTPASPAPDAERPDGRAAPVRPARRRA